MDVLTEGDLLSLSDCVHAFCGGASGCETGRGREILPTRQ
jgi:hypothetical protein